jgi:hypothetical protein
MRMGELKREWAGLEILQKNDMDECDKGEEMLALKKRTGIFERMMPNLVRKFSTSFPSSKSKSDCTIGNLTICRCRSTIGTCETDIPRLRKLIFPKGIFSENSDFRWLTHPEAFQLTTESLSYPELNEFLHRSGIFDMKRFGIFSNECLMNYQIQPNSYFGHMMEKGVISKDMDIFN